MASRELKVEIIGDSRSLQKALGSATDSTGKFGTAVAKMGKVAAVGLAALGAGAVVAGKKMIDMASDAAEVQSKMEVVFGKELPGLIKNLDKFSEATGASKFALREQAADMGALLAPMLGTKKAAAEQSEQWVKLATDIGSFNNVPVGDALLAIRSGLVGEAEPLRRFGVLLNEAAVKEEALRLGLVKGKEELTERDKVLARGSLIWKQTSLAQGDAERTAGSMANQMKRLRNNVTDMATNLGTLLIPMALKAAKAFNDNWPAIEKVVTAAMTMAVSAVQTAISAIQANFGTIKAVAIAAFNGVKGAIEGAVRFLRTDFGQTLGIGLAAVLALKGGLGLLGISIGDVSKALLTLKANPFWALAIPLGLLVGEIAGNFIQGKIAAQQLAEAMDRAAGSARGLKDALDAMKDSDLAVKEARFAHREATVRLHEAQRAYDDSVAKSGAKSKESLQLHRDLTAAKLAEERADLTLEQAIKRQTDAHNARNQKLREGKQELFNLSAEAAKSNATFAQTGTQEKYAAAVQKIGAEALITAGKAQKMGDEAGAKAAAKVAILADAAADLAIKLGRVPSKKEIIAEAKMRGKNETLSAAEKLIADLGKLDASDEGAEVGHGFGQAMANGIGSMIDVVRQAAASLAIAARQGAGKAAQESSPPRVWVELGVAMAQALAQGLADETPNTKDKAAQFVTETSNILELVKSKGYSLGNAQVQAVIDGIVGKQPSLKQQIMTAIDEANAAAIERVNAARQGFADALGQLAQAGLAAFDAKVEGWENPLRKKLEGEKLQETADKLQADVTAAAEKMDALQGAFPPLKLGEIPSEDWKKAEADYLAAKAEYDAAVKAQQDFQNEQDILALDAAHAAKIAAQRENLSDELNEVISWIQKHPKEWEKGQKKIIAVFKRYGIDYRASGKVLGEEFAKGIKDGIAAVGSAVEELAEAIAKKLKGRSPPKEGPLRDINKWGISLAKTFMDGWAKGMKQQARRIVDGAMWKDLLEQARSAEGFTGELSFGGVAEPKDAFAGFKPDWADADIWAAAMAMATSAGKLADLMESVGFGGSVRSNARLLDLMFQNRTRWNWNDVTGKVKMLLDLMKTLGLSGAEVASQFGLATGGITKETGWRFLHNDEAIIPLSRYSGPPSRRGGIVVNINNPIGGMTRAQADAVAAEVESAFARKQGRTSSLAF